MAIICIANRRPIGLWHQIRSLNTKV